MTITYHRRIQELPFYPYGMNQTFTTGANPIVRDVYQDASDAWWIAIECDDVGDPATIFIFVVNSNSSHSNKGRFIKSILPDPHSRRFVYQEH